MKRLEYEESPARLQSCSSVPRIRRVSGEHCFSAMVVQGVPIHPQTNHSLLQHTARGNLLPQLIQDKTLDGIITKTGGSNFTKDIEEEMGMGINRAKRLSGIPDGGSREVGSIPSGRTLDNTTRNSGNCVEVLQNWKCCYSDPEENNQIKILL
ncbi:hypothetical protein EOD39_20979 [Acipenser ruthenus]|uniref:Uncharacterized protein n=1 Tax=Acipenser ruthenus TaxID=7906 RepID=A0A444UTZ0_ACIRT|nr:hypothetical protein EOD39_20979 [Acipenser ruthenus]